MAHFSSPPRPQRKSVEALDELKLINLIPLENALIKTPENDSKLESRK
jgi:hypothetical protein